MAVSPGGRDMIGSLMSQGIAGGCVAGQMELKYVGWCVVVENGVREK